MVPVHPDNQFLLGMQWENNIFIDKALPLGLRSAPLIFSAVADALQYMIQRNRATFVDHYINDFITVGSPT